MNVEQFWFIPKRHAHDSHGTCKIAHDWLWIVQSTCGTYIFSKNFILSY
jgi:hypothetical protein